MSPVPSGANWARSGISFGGTKITIRDVLPVPSTDISVDELSRFKAESSEQLRNLRIHLNGKLAERGYLVTARNGGSRLPDQ
jgi:hypothetical protein